MVESLVRIEFTGEVPGPGTEIVVVNDDHAEVEVGATDDVELPSTPIVRTRVMASIAIVSFIVDGHKESGFKGVWTSQLDPDSPPIPVLIVGSRNSGKLRVLPTTDNPSHAIVTDQSGANRYYLKRQAA